MPRRNPLHNISTSGGLLTADFLQSMREEDFNHQLIQPKTFSLPKTPIQTQKELDRHINDAWEKLKARWDTISLKLKEMDVTEARRRWIEPLLRELGFSFVKVSEPISLEDGSIKIYLSHRGWWEDDAPRIHTIFPEHDLDKRQPIDRNDKSPHDALQLYLNLDKTDQKWAILTNGILLRLLRDFYHTYTRGYVEFDLENIFNEHNVTDFRILFRLAHASRFRPCNGTIPLEKFYEESVAAGIKIGEDLRYNVKEAIEQLGNGLLNRKWRKKMVDDPELTKQFYQEILKIIYRILFLMFAEQRGMMPMRDSLYAEEYSLTRLRERAESRILKESHYDLWYGLIATFELVREGSEKLRVFGYNGELFEDTNLEIIPCLQCRNDILLRVIKYLTCYQKGKILQRINFLDIGVEEIGSIYESLLDFTPRVLKASVTIENREYSKGQFLLDPRGASRKTTGSYYTDHRLINELVNSALKPVLEKALASAGSSLEEKENALLNLKVCDPACGSGAFLIAANDFLGKRLAQIRTREEFPSEREERIARRDVLSHCIYAVDLNPMAIELAKVSLWINASVRDFPLNFLDHHLKCGNSLIGTTPKLISKGIPDGVFKAIKGEDKKLTNEWKKINKDQKRVVKFIGEVLIEPEKAIEIEKFSTLRQLPEITKEEVILKKEKYLKLIHETKYQRQKLIYDTWTSIFFWYFIKEWKEPPTQAIFQLIVEGSLSTIKDSKHLLSKIEELSSSFAFFHWNLEFPEVFSSKSKGFSCILGNPPWETVEFREKEFLLAIAPKIAALTGVRRKQAIKTLLKENSDLYESWKKDVQNLDRTKRFIKQSGIFKLSSKGRMNTYVLFTDLISSTLLGKNGRAGIIVKTGLAVNDTTKKFFQFLYGNNMLVSLYDFENREHIFKDVHRSERFCLLTLEKSKSPKKMDFSFFLLNLDQLRDPNLHFTLTSDDFELINPNNKNCPTFRNNRDAEITKQVYSLGYTFLRESKEETVNPWNVTIRQGLFNLSSDANLFLRINDLIDEGFELEKSSIFHKPNSVKYLPVYEGRMIWIYDHRASSITTREENIFREGLTKETTQIEHEDRFYEVLPKFWVSEIEIEDRIPDWYDKNWIISFRRITAATNERTLIASIIPRYGAGDTAALIFLDKEISSICCLLANLNSIVLDYIARQKTGGTHMDFFILKQLPVIPPERYNDELKMRISEIVAKLTYTSNSLDSFAKELNYTAKIKWDVKDRIELMAELNAIYAHFYEISRIDLEYILETFPIVKRNELSKYGEYLTKKFTLRFYDKLVGVIN